MAQNLTNFIPAGSIPAQFAQNATNVLQTLTDTGVTSMINLIPDATSPIGIGISINADMGLPLVLALEALGGPASGLNALGSSVTAFANAVQTGNVSAAAAAILDAPAVVANGFLNGQTTLPLSLTVSLGGTDFPTVLNVPLDGILTPAAPYTALVDSSGLGIPGLVLDASVTGTPSAASCRVCFTSCRQISRPRSAGLRRRSSRRCRSEGRASGSVFARARGQGVTAYLQVMYL